MLTSEQTNTLREKLMSDRKRLLDSAHTALNFTMDRDRGRIGHDSLDESSEEAMYATQLRLHDREKHLLTKIETALQRLDLGIIDECDDCGDKIGYQRLAARPVTQLCIECKSDREQGENS